MMVTARQSPRRASDRRLLVLAAATLTVAAAVAAAFLYRFQEVLLFHPIPWLPDTPRRLGLDHREVSLTAADGTGLAAWWLPREGAPGTILYCGGSIGNMGVRAPALRGLNALGWNVLVFDYRGYGRSEGRPSEGGVKLDAAAAWEWLLGEGGQRPERIVVWGRSLGGAVALWLATRPDQPQPAAVIVESTFTSATDAGAERFPWLPVRRLSRLRFDSLALIPDLRVPLLLAHSPDDEVVGIHHARALLTAAGSPHKEFVLMAGRHNAGHLTREEYRGRVEHFLNAVLAGGT